MFTELSMPGEFSYNGVPFDAASTVKVACENVKDPAGRTTTAFKITLDASGYIAPAADDTVESLRIALGRQGGPLVYTGNSFPIVVNVPGRADSLTDIGFGPSPEVLEWETLGGEKSAKFRWRCTTTITACESSANFGPFQELNYQVSWAKKPNGYQTRTISGHYKIPLGRFNPTTLTTSRVITNHADLYREQLEAKFRTCSGWKRSTNYTLGADKATELFTITDEEIESENPYPPGVTNIQARHRIAWQFRGGGRIQNRLSATISMSAGYGPIAAQGVFRQLCDLRLGKALRFAKQTGGICFIESMEGDENLFGKDHSFSIAYRISGNPNGNNQNKNGLIVLGQDFLRLSAFGEPVTRNTWDQWNESMQDGPHSPRGTGNASGTTWGKDRIVDLCDNEQTTFTAFDFGKPRSLSGASSVWAVEKPREEASYVSYKHNWTKYGHANSVATARQLTQKADFKNQTQSQTTQNGSAFMADDIKQFSGAAQFDDSKITRVVNQGGGDLWLVKGSAERVSFPLPNIPSSIKLVDQKATLLLLRGYVASMVTSSPLGLKLHTGAFAALYVANKTLKEAPPAHCYP